jgi:hypothetical protein
MISCNKRAQSGDFAENGALPARAGEVIIFGLDLNYLWKLMVDAPCPSPNR